ncbi:MAG: Rne/Rng family ribonuclease [Thiobacillaceae bacterium]
MKRMLFNATQAEELRVAIVEGQKLVDLDIESASKEQRKGNIYKGIVTRVEPSLEAAFIDYGCERHGFLPFKEISRACLPGNGRPQDALKEGQELLVQVEKDERGNKGAALTTYISLAGRYVVLMPTNPRGGGVSRRIEGEDRNELRDALASLEIPEGMSLIARTAGIGHVAEEFQWDLDYLLRIWQAIESAAAGIKGTDLIYLESNLITRAIRDHFSPDIGEILIDTEDVYEQAYQFMANVMPDNVSKVKLYRDDVPLFSRFQIEHQIESAYSRQVNLPSGGAIVIDHTEALVSVDVNSARATKGSDVEQTAYNTNLEAAEEVARQMRLRDLGGLIVIDFIDMEEPKHQREVENRLRDALHHDRARVQTSKISRFGLLEMSRQRLQPSLGETSYNPCPRCHGTGHIRGTESSALHILRILQEEAMKENTGALHVQLPVDVATFLLNEKRVDIHTLETRLKVTVMLIPNIHLETPNYSIARLRHDELNRADAAEPSYKMATMPETDEDSPMGAAAAQPAPRLEAAVKSIAPAQRAPTPSPAALVPPQSGMFDRIFGWFKKSLADEPATNVPAANVPAATETRTRERSTTRPERTRDRKPSSTTRRTEGRNEPRDTKEPRESRAPRADRTNDRNGEAAKPARAPRPPRQPRADKPLENEARPALDAADSATPNEAREPREPRNRRGRGGRGRNREDRPQQEASNAVSSVDTAQADAAPVNIATPQTSAAPQQFGAVVESAPASRTPAPAQATAIQTMPATASQQSLALETRPSHAGNTPQAVLAASQNSDKRLQQVETQGTSISQDADSPRGDRTRRRRRPATSTSVTEPALQQVETAFTPALGISNESASPVPHPTRRRQRPPAAVVNEPLVQVETGNPQ